MIYAARENDNNKRASERLKHPFCFHFKRQVFKGENFSTDGVGVRVKRDNRGEFNFFRGQSIKEASIEIEGQTIYISKLKICWLEDANNEEMLFGMTFESIVAPEKQKLQQIYDCLKG